MAHLVGFAALRTPDGVVELEGMAFRSDVSLYITEPAAGEGPVMHKHPYPETFIVLEGAARFVIAGQEHVATAGTIVVVPADAPHRFTGCGPGRARVVSIHPSPSFQQTDLPAGG